jgi:hypothetical protein
MAKAPRNAKLCDVDEARKPNLAATSTDACRSQIAGD